MTPVEGGWCEAGRRGRHVHIFVNRLHPMHRRRHMRSQLCLELVYSAFQRSLVFSRGSVSAKSRAVATARKARGTTHDATTSLGFCDLIHCNEKRLHVEHGVSPSQRIFLRRHRSQALETDFLRGCQSFTAAGENWFGPSPAGSEAVHVVSC